MATSRRCRALYSILLALSLLGLDIICLAGTGQSRYLAYSTYNLQPGDITLAAVSSVGELCVSSSTQLFKLHSDGSVAYKKTVAAESLTAVSADTAGNCYLSTRSGHIPMSVSKYDPQGNVVYVVNYAGSGSQAAQGMDVDASGNLWLTGYTSSNDLQLVNPMQGQGALKGQEDAFIAEFNSSGTLIFSTYFGGSDTDSASALALDASGNVYLTGQTYSTDFPLLNPLESSFSGSGSAFLSKIDNTGQLLYSTYLGRALGFNGCGLATDAASDMLLTGDNGGGQIIIKLNAAGSLVLYSVVPTNPSNCAPITVDSQGNAYTAGAFQPLLDPIQSDSTDAELVGLDPSGNVIFASYFGNFGSGALQSLDYIGVDSAGNLYTDILNNLYYPVPILNAANGVYPYFSTCQICGYAQSFVAKVALGTGPSFSMPATVDFVPTPVGQPDPNEPPVTIYNTGTTSIDISAINISGDYSQTNNCPLSPTPLASATACTFHLIFTPTATGTRNGLITIDDDSPGGPHAIQLTGTGTVPVATVSPTFLNFGSEYVGGTTAAQIVTIKNTGGATLNISRIAVAGDYAETNDCGSGQLGSGESCTVSVTFGPAVTGTRNGTLSISDNAANSPQIVGLTGTGTEPSLGLGVASGGSSSDTVSAGATAGWILAIGGQGMSGTATLSCTGAPTGAACTVPASENLSGTSASNFQVSVTTTARNSAMLGSPRGHFTWMWAIGIFGMMLLPSMRRVRRGRLHLLPFALLLLLCSCGGGGGSSSGKTGTPAGTYTVTVKATMGSATSSTVLTLIVQ